MTGDALAMKSLKNGHLEERFVQEYICAYNMAMNYEWDEHKARSNYRKYGVDFAHAVSVFVVDQYGHTFGLFRHVKPAASKASGK